MKFQDNFSETNLLFGAPVQFLVYDETNPKSKVLHTTSLLLPRFRHYYFDYKFQNFLYILNHPLEETISKISVMQDITSMFRLYRSLILFPDANRFYYEVFSYSMSLFLPDLTVSRGIPYICGLEMSEEFFDRIINLILISTANKNLSDLAIVDPKMKEMQDKINKIKKQKNKTTSSPGFTDSYMILTYEFGYKPEEILNMTLYCINTILKYTGKAINYRVSVVAAGNGLSKKIHFITEKGK